MIRTIRLWFNSFTIIQIPVMSGSRSEGVQRLAQILLGLENK